MNGEVLHVMLGREAGSQIVFIISFQYSDILGILYIHMISFHVIQFLQRKCALSLFSSEKKCHVLGQPLHFTDEELRSRQVK